MHADQWIGKISKLHVTLAIWAVHTKCYFILLIYLRLFRPYLVLLHTVS